MPAEAAGHPSAWDRVAGLYDLQLPLESRALDAALDLAAPAREERLLDLATGTGVLLRRLARRRDPPRQAVGVDSSAAMLARARALPPAWRLRVADATALPFDDATFDAVTAAYLLHLLDPPTRQEVIGEARRVLGPGDRLVVVTVARPQGGALAPIWAALARSARPGSGIIAGMRTLDPRDELTEAGFAVRRARLTTRGYPSLVVLAERKR